MLASNLPAAGLSLLTALLWGVGDFSGGLAAKRANAFGVVLFAYIAGLLLLVNVVLWRHEPLPLTGDVTYATIAGLVGGLALAAFYQALAIGSMAIVAPIASLLTAALPVVYGSFVEGFPRPLQLMGFCLAAASLWFISNPNGSRLLPQGLALAVFAGITFGVYIILIKKAGSHSAIWPVLISRASSCVLLLAIVLFARKAWVPGVNVFPITLLAGSLDVIGTVLFVAATQLGRLDISIVLASLYPAFTVLLARSVLRERITRTQALGIAAALAAVPLITLR